jgi:hypothetical protein
MQRMSVDPEHFHRDGTDVRSAIAMRLVGSAISVTKYMRKLTLVMGFIY